MIDALRKVIKRMHYPLEVMLTCFFTFGGSPSSSMGGGTRFFIAATGTCAASPS